jgi:hypothetical protein
MLAELRLEVSGADVDCTGSSLGEPGDPWAGRHDSLERRK